jgi:DNA-binding CsgD family transcriptional regulator
VRLSERDEDLRRLEQVYATWQQGRGSVVVTDGPVGGGKTALLWTFVESVVRRKGQFFSVTGAVTERAHPFALMRRLVDSMCPAGMTDPFAAEDGAPPGSAAFEDATFQQVHTICQAICSFAEDRPLIIAVDDVQFADEQSLRCLGHLARRVESSPIVLLINQGSGWESELTILLGEFLPLNHCHWIALAPLSASGVAEQLADAGAPSVTAEVVQRYLEVTGGSPLLLRAVIEDSRASDEPRPAASFRVSLLRCLRRCAPEMVQVARAMAVLGCSASPPVVAEFLGLDAANVAQRMADLSDLGLLADKRFRHEQTRLAVLADVPSEHLPSMYGHAAEVLHDRGALPVTVADQLMATRNVERFSWAVPILQLAAREAIAAGAIDDGAAYLRRAAATATDPRQKAELTAALSEAHWDIDPHQSVPQLDELCRDVRSGLLTGHDAMIPVKQLIWWGDAPAAAELLAAAYAHADDRAGESIIGLWLSFCFPGYAPARTGARSSSRSAWDTPTPAHNVMGAAARLAGDAGPAMSIEQTLRDIRIEGPFSDMLCALLILYCTGRTHDAIRVAQRLLDDETARRVPMRRAMLETIRSLAALRRGAAREALDHAQTALDRVAPSAWGIVVGIPLSLAIRAATELNDFEAVAGYLREAVPAGMFDSPLALPYLRAIGRYHLAMDSPQTALEHFQACRDLTNRWQLANPELMDWRTDAAAALIAMGRLRSARQMLEEHLRHLREEHKHSRGLALRLLALTAPLRERPPLFTEAARLLNAEGDLLEAGRALDDLTAVQSTLPATDVVACDSLSPRPAASAEVVHATDLPSDADATLAQLTDAERRVASLAAAGWTNRQIAETLFVTISTVEQHLTKIYRKLKVRRRSALRTRLIHYG